MEDSRVLKVSQLRDGEADVVRAHAGKVGFNAHQFAGVGVGQRMQQGCVDDAVDGGGGSDAEGHGGDRNDSESRRPRAACETRSGDRRADSRCKRKTLLGVVAVPVWPAPRQASVRPAAAPRRATCRRADSPRSASARCSAISSCRRWSARRPVAKFERRMKKRRRNFMAGPPL